MIALITPADALLGRVAFTFAGLLVGFLPTGRQEPARVSGCFLVIPPLSLLASWHELNLPDASFRMCLMTRLGEITW